MTNDYLKTLFVSTREELGESGKPAKPWAGNRVEPGRWACDGAALVDTSRLSKAALKVVSKKPNSFQTQAQIERMLVFYGEAGGAPGVVVGYVLGDLDRGQGILLNVSGKGAVFCLKRWFWMHEALAPDSVKISVNPTNAIANFFKAGVRVGILMSQNPACFSERMPSYQATFEAGQANLDALCAPKI